MHIILIADDRHFSYFLTTFVGYSSLYALIRRQSNLENGSRALAQLGCYVVCTFTCPLCARHPFAFEATLHALEQLYADSASFVSQLVYTRFN